MYKEKKHTHTTVQQCLLHQCCKNYYAENCLLIWCHYN